MRPPDAYSRPKTVAQAICEKGFALETPDREYFREDAQKVMGEILGFSNHKILAMLAMPEEEMLDDLESRVVEIVAGDRSKDGKRVHFDVWDKPRIYVTSKEKAEIMSRAPYARVLAVLEIVGGQG